MKIREWYSSLKNRARSLANPHTARRLAFFAAALVIISPIVRFARVQACGPDFEPEVFVAEHHPDKPALYADGHLGILQTGYYHAELVIAYRYLSGSKLSDAEKAAYIPAMQESDNPYSWDEQQQKESAAATDAWFTARNAITGSGIVPKAEQSRDMQQLHQPSSDDQILNCTNSAFVTAAQTLADRTRVWRTDSAELKEWLRGQDAVFSNCPSEGQMPGAPDPQWKPLLRQDRAYQIAAAQFYARHFDEAIAGFEAIARDKSSPWSRWGEYLAARAEIRKAAMAPPPPAASPAPGSPPAENPAFNLDLLKAARGRLTRLLSQSRDPEIQHAATQELHLVEVRLDPSKRLDDAAAALAGPAPDPDFAQDLTDLDRLIASAHATADLAVWVQHMQGVTPDKAPPLSVDEWRSKRTLPWIVASMIYTPADMPEDLLRAAAEVSPQSPGYDTVNYLRAQWMLGSQHDADARMLLTSMLAHLSNTASDSTRNALLAERMPTARNLSEFLADAPRTLIDAESEAANMAKCDSSPAATPCSAPLPPKEFDGDAAAYLNTQMPLATLEQVAQSPQLPAHLRQAVAEIAWVRAIGLNDTAAVQKMSALLPTPIRKTAGDGDDFPATLAILHAPGMRPFLDQGVQRSATYAELDHYRDNWWCGSWTVAGTADQNGNGTPPPQLPKLGFLTAAQQKQAADETARLNALPPGLVWLGRRAIAYVKAHPDDKQAAETLANVVHGTRYGCDYDDYGPPKQPLTPQQAVSKEAFEMLHRMYPHSEWAQKTKYWY